LTGILWQRCLFHLQQNAQNYVPCKAMQKQVAEDIRMIFNAPSREKQRYIWQKLLRNMLRFLQNWLTGWR
jgi:transposase-like protein